MQTERFFIKGQWVAPLEGSLIDVIQPATEKPYTRLAMGGAADADRAVQAARAAFPAFSQTTREERISLLQAVLDAYRRRHEALAQAVSQEMGAPLAFARSAQVSAGKIHLKTTLEALRSFPFEMQRGGSRIVREPIGVCALITPWNWPLNQIACKVAPALAAGCTMVLKPSELAPLSALLFAEILEEAGVPAGVFNLVNGFGPVAGEALARHPDVDMVSFTGSTRAGVQVAKAAADTVKRVAQELGGKSPNLLLPDADFPAAVAEGVSSCFSNAGQSCDAPTRMLVPEARLEEVIALARAAAAAVVVGPPEDPASALGPVISRTQFDKIQGLIQRGIDEGAELVCGGLGRPDGLTAGYFVRPTVFARVTPDMAIAREEIFGPVLSILTYRTVDEAIQMANDTPYGLAAYVQSQDLNAARVVARQLRAGSVYINYPDWDTTAPFGGYKQSGNGREYADWGIHDFLELKGIVGYGS